MTGAIEVKQILIHLALTVFGTMILTYAVINHEPPAFLAYAFGIITGLCWGGIVLLWWVHQDDDKNYRDFER